MPLTSPQSYTPPFCFLPGASLWPAVSVSLSHQEHLLGLGDPWQGVWSLEADRKLLPGYPFHWILFRLRKGLAALHPLTLFPFITATAFPAYSTPGKDVGSESWAEVSQLAFQPPLPVGGSLGTCREGEAAWLLPTPGVHAPKDWRGVKTNLCPLRPLHIAGLLQLHGSEQIHKASALNIDSHAADSHAADSHAAGGLCFWGS